MGRGGHELATSSCSYTNVGTTQLNCRLRLIGALDGGGGGAACLVKNFSFNISSKLFSMRFKVTSA